MTQFGPEGLDRIEIRGITATGYHGVLPTEREQGQQFVVDVVLFGNIRPASRTDRLEATVDYSQVAQVVSAIVAGPAVNLIETLAEEIATQVLVETSGLPRHAPDTVVADRVIIEAVEVTVHKPDAPVGVPFGDVAVTVTRYR